MGRRSVRALVPAPTASSRPIHSGRPPAEMYLDPQTSARPVCKCLVASLIEGNPHSSNEATVLYFSAGTLISVRLPVGAGTAAHDTKPNIGVGVTRSIRRRQLGDWCGTIAEDMAVAIRVVGAAVRGHRQCGGRTGHLPRRGPTRLPTQRGGTQGRRLPRYRQSLSKYYSLNRSLCAL